MSEESEGLISSSAGRRSSKSLGGSRPVVGRQGRSPAGSASDS